MRCGKIVWVSVFALVLASSAWSEPVLLTDYRPLGGYYVQTPTAPYGYLWLAAGAPAVNVHGAGYGVAFSGPTEVTSMTVAQSSDLNRMMIESFLVYADGVHVGYAHLEPTKNAQPVQFVDLNGLATTITATWIVLKSSADRLYPSDQYTQYGDDKNVGVFSLEFYGTPCTTPEINLNTGMRVDAAGVRYVTNSQAPSWVLEGTLKSQGNAGVFWSRNDSLGGTAEQWLTVFYEKDDGEGGKVADPLTVGSIGLSLVACHMDRSIPQWVVITGSDGQWLKVPINEILTQYNRYDHGWDSAGQWVAFESVFVDTGSLTISFPPATGDNTADAANWWFMQGPVEWFGLVEFQAFAPVPVPEPATMTLLALGGLTILRRRK